MEAYTYVSELDTASQGSQNTRYGLTEEQFQQGSAMKNVPDRIGAFIGLPVNGWIKHAKLQPDAKMLFGPFWFEGEICILFASSNQGKTILAVQIAESIGSGKPILGFPLETVPQPVAYFDFELSMKQFELRYTTEGGSHYEWSDNVTRYEISRDAEIPHGFPDAETYMVYSIEQVIMQTGVKSIIIDNLTYLSNDTETAKGAAPLMKRIKELKSRYNLSILVLAHSPKRDSSKPISPNDLQGSSRLMQFCDSCFAIGPSNQGSDTKYLKQIKVRNAAFEYDADNVIVCKILKESSFLHFERMSVSKEREHLKTPTKGDKSELITRIHELTTLGKTQRQIAEEIGTISPAKVNRLLKASQNV